MRKPAWGRRARIPRRAARPRTAKPVPPLDRSWKSDEDDVIRQRYGTTAPAEIAAELERPLHSVYKRARQLGLTAQRNVWTPAELRLLEENFAVMTNDQIAAVIAHTPNQIRNKAGELGLTKKPLPKDTLELIWMMKAVPDVTLFFAAQLRVRERVIARALATMRVRGGP